MEEEKALTRRDFLGWIAAAAALALLPGCGSAYQAEVAPGRARRRRASLSGGAPSPGAAYTAGQPYVIVPQPAQVVYSPGYAVAQQPAAPAFRPAPAVPPPPPARLPAGSGIGKLRAVSRRSWATTPPNPAKMRPMNAVTRITIHHEGSAKPNNDTTPQQVAATLRRIQGQHAKRMGAGDIGYHFIIDRTGGIWQGRDSRYQGAHTSGANSSNVGVMLLGNFELQQPTGGQVSSLHNLVLSLSRMYGLNPRTDIHGHSDFCNTQCPGKYLKQYVKAFKA